MRWWCFRTTYWVPGGVALSLCTAIMHTEHDGVRRRTAACTVRGGDEPSAANEGSATRVAAIASQGRLPGPLPRVGNIPAADNVGQAGIGHRHRKCQQQEQQHGGGVSYEVVVVTREVRNCFYEVDQNSWCSEGSGLKFLLCWQMGRVFMDKE